MSDVFSLSGGGVPLGTMAERWRAERDGEVGAPPNRSHVFSRAKEKAPVARGSVFSLPASDRQIPWSTIAVAGRLKLIVPTSREDHKIIVPLDGPAAHVALCAGITHHVSHPSPQAAASPRPRRTSRGSCRGTSQPPRLPPRSTCRIRTSPTAA